MLKKILVQVKTPIQIQEDKEYKLVTISNTGNITLRKVIKGSQISADQAYSVKKGAFIYSRLSIHTGAFGLVPDELDGALVTSEMPLFDIMDNTVPDFLIYSLKLPEFSFQLNNLTKGMGRTRVKEDTFLSLHIDIPSIEIQKRLIKEISDKENQISLITQEHLKQIDALKKLRQQILQDAVQGKLVPQDTYDEPASKLLERIKADKEKLVREKKIKKDKPLPPIKPEEIPFEIPENWVWCRLGEIASIVRGGSPRPAGDKRFYDGAIPFLKVADLTSDEKIYLDKHTYTIKEAGLHKTRYVGSNTLMLTNSGATLGVPKICMFPTTFNDGIAAFLGLNNMDKEFIYYFLKSKTGWYLKEASRGQGQPNLNTDIISMTPFSLPPFPEQYRIVTKIEQLMSLCNELEQTILQNQKYTQELLQMALKEALEQKN